jgi:hypothetical protein
MASNVEGIVAIEKVGSRANSTGNVEHFTMSDCNYCRTVMRRGTPHSPHKYRPVCIHGKAGIRRISHKRLSSVTENKRACYARYPGLSTLLLLCPTG